MSCRKYSIDVNIKDYFDKTSLDYALERLNIRATDYLESMVKISTKNINPILQDLDYKQLNINDIAT